MGNFKAILFFSLQAMLVVPAFGWILIWSYMLDKELYERFREFLMGDK